MSDPVLGIIEKFQREGIEAVTADDSAEIKGFIRENGHEHETSKMLVELFPLEADEICLEDCDPADCTGR